MDAHERHLAVLHNTEPDKVNILFAEGLRAAPPGAWLNRAIERGVGFSHIIPPYLPMFFYDSIINPGLEDVVFSCTYYFDNHVQKIRYQYNTPVGSVFSIVGRNPGVDLLTNSPEIGFVKQPADWRVVNYIFRRMTKELHPNYEAIRLDQEMLGGKGTTIAIVDKTPFQRGWIEMASLERTVMDFTDQPEEFQEYLEVQGQFHQKAAEITAGCPAQEILLIDNITNIISPRLYRQYCLPYYKLYTDAFAGTDKVLAVHHDGRFGHIQKEMANATFGVIDSFTVPPTGDISLADARRLFPGKVLFMNLPPHLAYAEDADLHRGYEELMEEWGSKILTIEHVEDLPPDRLEKHIQAAMDVCGY